MKKLFYFMAALPLFMACSSDDTTEEVTKENTLPSTEVFVQGQALQYNPGTKAVTRAADDPWPYHTNEGWETARFSIRADGTIPDHTDKSSALYYGRFQGGHNRGRVSTLFPYDHYDDRGLDYYQKDKKTGNNIGLFRYIYDTEGRRTQLAILEYPPVENILNDELEDLQNAIDKGSNVAKNTAEKEKVQELLAKGSEYLNSHVLWYVVKEVGMQYGWHVNGVFTEQPVSKYEIDPSKVADNVEVDIHLQEHVDWNEIKTSVHVRTDAESVTINLPIKEEYIVEQDDFAIRVYDYAYKEYTLTHEVVHDANGITIKISNIAPDFINELKYLIGDGLTVEIHSYCTQLEGVWEELKKSTVVTGKPCTVKGQVTSAYAPNDRVDLSN